MKKNKKIIVNTKIFNTINELFEDNNNFINDLIDNNNPIIDNPIIETNNDENKYKICELCNFKTLSTSAIIKHYETNKHKNKLNPISNKCTKCDYEASNKWNLNLHITSQHLEKEDKLRSKLYCNICDTIFFSDKYLIKHNEGKKHKNQLKYHQIINNDQSQNNNNEFFNIPIIKND